MSPPRHNCRTVFSLLLISSIFVILHCSHPLIIVLYPEINCFTRVLPLLDLCWEEWKKKSNITVGLHANQDRQFKTWGHFQSVLRQSIDQKSWGRFACFVEDSGFGPSQSPSLPPSKVTTVPTRGQGTTSHQKDLSTAKWSLTYTTPAWDLHVLPHASGTKVCLRCCSWSHSVSPCTHVGGVCNRTQTPTQL